MKAIIAINNIGVMGDSESKYGLPWHCPDDLAKYNEKTAGKILLAGYNTVELMPTLQDRTILVDTRFHKLPETTLKNVDWVIGGKKTIQKYWDDIDEFHVHHIADSSDGDCSWPELNDVLFKDFLLVEIIKHDEFDECIWVRDH